MSPYLRRKRLHGIHKSVHLLTFLTAGKWRLLPVILLFHKSVHLSPRIFTNPSTLHHKFVHLSSQIRPPYITNLSTYTSKKRLRLAISIDLNVIKHYLNIYLNDYESARKKNTPHDIVVVFYKVFFPFMAPFLSSFSRNVYSYRITERFFAVALAYSSLYRLKMPRFADDEIP